ncbi:MAG: transglutaminase TgpA family protein [Oceanococcus sp.]
MSSPARTDHLSAAKVHRILLVLLLIAAPHFAHIPLWATVLVVAVGIWRTLAASRTWAMPRPLLRQLATATAAIAVYMQYQTLNGHHAGVALLMVMLGMKLTEMTTRRDYLLVIYLSYFLLITHFLFNQDLGMIVLLLAGALAITTVLVDVNHPQGVLPWKEALRLGGVLMLQAVPLMVIFFVLFPRIPGPLWGLPSNSGTALSGLSDSMSPGAISNLSMSDAVAFRARFYDQVPPRNKLYWRGPVFEYYNGSSWLEGPWQDVPRPVSAELISPAIDYEIQLEPHGKKWLLALDVPVKPWPADAKVNSNLLMLSKYDVIDKKLLKLSSVLDYRVDRDLSKYQQQRRLSLPPNINPKARELARQWADNAATQQDIIDQALRFFRQELFVYTLQPPIMAGQHSIDEFLFGERRGFCEHYAGAFTFLMRAAGIPARIVTGYQGAEANADYYIIRQSDAHAWSEVWLEGQGWVRVDPTAAVSPERIELGLGGALGAGEPIPGLARLNRNLFLKMQLQWDQVNALWDRWILAYGPELQQSFLAALGLPGLRAILIALTLLTVGVLVLVNLLTHRAHRLSAEVDPVLQAWARFLRKLERSGIHIDPAQGPEDLFLQLEERQPTWLAEAKQIQQLYIHLRYASQNPDPLMLSRFKLRVRRFSANRRRA